MYEQHFGLTKRPFSVKAMGTEVFVGPQTAKTMAGFRKALAVQDAVVTVSGAVGTGKTTLVERALDAIGSKYKTIRVGRMQMNASDVLESLLIVLGVQDRPSGTIQRFSALRKKLKELQDRETRVFILVEDALRAGAETLGEIEALTVADAGESDGASIVLMGDERLFEFMKDPQLAQLQQRVRQRHRIQPLCVAELRGYLKHSLRVAGGDFEQIFDNRSAELLHGLSEGIPRVTNTLVDAVLVAAASQGVEKVSATMIATVAADEFGLSVDDFDFSDPVPDDLPDKDEIPVPTDTVEPAAIVEPAPVVEPDPIAEPEPDPVRVAPTQFDDEQPAPEPVLDVTPAPAENSDDSSEPVIVFADEDGESPDDPEDIPHLIQDTLPNLAILSKRYATLGPIDAVEAKDSETDAEMDAENIPELKPEPVATPEPAAYFETLAQPEPVAEDLPELIAEPTTAGEPKWELSAEPEFQLVTEVVPALETERAPDPAAVAEADADAGADSEDLAEFDADAKPVAEAIPELVAETEPADDAIPELVTEPQPVAALGPEALPELEVEPQSSGADEPAPQTDAEEIPEWERDPTLAQLKPDLDALEQALAFTHGEPLVKAQDAPRQAESLADSIGEIEELPEIILDESIETGIENLDVEEPSDILPPSPVTKSDPELDRIAADIANAKSLEDIDDIMAETLFGTGISMIAAQITANPPEDDSANDELQLMPELPATSVPVPEEKLTPVVKEKPASRRSKISEEISIETRSPVANTGLDLSASQRLKTVRALNADLHPSLREPENRSGVGSTNAAASNAPQPIEDQINTSITQTLKALKVPPEILDDEPDEETKKGFFGRFRRS